MAARAGSEVAAMSDTSLARTSDREIVIARTFNGPARIVFDAWTRPELVSRWWAPRELGVAMVSCEADVRVGGRYRYVLRPGQGDEVAFSGTYTEITPHSRLVYTTVLELKGVEAVDESGAAIVTVTFDERDGKTHLVSRERYPSKEVLDGVLASGMERGLRATMDQLDDLVASLR
jgi:uncharacterized protein YndB with AHSA1/START domain